TYQVRFHQALPAVGGIRDSMARKANSSKPPGPKTGFRPSFERAKPPTKPPKAAAAADPGTSAQQGMLQLTFARHAHGYGFLAAIAFFFHAVLLVTFRGRRLPLCVIPLIYPTSAAGVPLTIISMGLTWQGLGARKLGSLGAALIMPVLMVFLTLFSANFTVETESGRALFIIIYLIGALTT